MLAYYTGLQNISSIDRCAHNRHINSHADALYPLWLGDLNLSMGLYFHPYCLHMSSNGSGESVYLHRLAQVFIAR